MPEREDGMSMDGLIHLISSNLRTLLIVVIIAIGASYGSSFLMKPLFKSTLVLFPTSQNSISESIVKGGKGFLDFGGELDVEKMLQVLNSNDIRDEIIKKYSLYNHYEIDKEKKNARTYVIQEYKEKVLFKKSEYLSIEVIVYDTEPAMAANIANSIGELLDSTQNRIQKERAIRGLEILDDKLMELNNSIELLEDSLDKFHRLGVLDFNSQVAVYSEYYAQAVSAGKTKAAQQLKLNLDLIAENGVEFVALQRDIESLKLIKGDLEVQYFSMKIDAEEDFIHKFVVNNAEKPELKSKPKRLVFVIVGSFSALMFSLLFLTFLERKP